MNGTNRPDAVTALALFEPEADVLYSIERAAQFTGMPRRHIVLYARRGLVTPAIDSRGDRLIFHRRSHPHAAAH